MTAHRATARRLLHLAALLLAATLASCMDGDFNADYVSDPFARGVVDGLSRSEAMLRDVEAQADLSAERKLELLGERIAAEIEAMEAVLDEEQPTEADGGDR